MQDDNPFKPPQSHVEDVGLPTRELASLSQRLGAAILDTFLILLIYMMWMSVNGGLDMESAGLERNEQAELTEQLGLFILYFVVNGYLLVNYGQTVGKRLLKIKIVDMSGRLPGITQLIGVREMLFMAIGYIPVIGGGLALADVLMIFRGNRRCIHDLLAGTQVVRA